MALLIDAINVKRRTLFEFENTPFYCLDAEVNTPTARGGQTLVRSEDSQPSHERGL
jgi:elongation factor P